MKLIYDVNDKPKFRANLVFAFQQLLAIIAATLLVPTLVNSAFGEAILDQGAALFGAGAGTLVYILFTKKKSPVFLGSSFAFISPLIGACSFGYFGILIGAFIAGIVYVIIALIVHFAGTNWVDKLLPPVVIGPVVALIGLNLCGSAINNVNNTAASPDGYNLVCILIGIITFFATVLASVKGTKTMKLIPFIIGIAAGYAAASVFTVIGNKCGIDYLKIVDYSPLANNFETVTFGSFISLPKFTFLGALNEGAGKIDVAAVVKLFALFAPVAFVVFAEHIADHKNLGSIIDRDLIKDPGLPAPFSATASAPLSVRFSAAAPIQPTAKASAALLSPAMLPFPPSVLLQSWRFCFRSLRRLLHSSTRFPAALSAVSALHFTASLLSAALRCFMKLISANPRTCSL